MSAYLEVNSLSKSFGSIKAVDNLSFSAIKGEIISLLGPNGAGKSTLMNMICGYLAADSGQTKIMDYDLKLSPKEAKKSIGFLPEGSPLYDDMPVEHFLHYLAELKSVPAMEVREILDLANINNVKNQKIETLSKGYKHRVGFAASLLGNPPVLILDEPTDGLDPNQKSHIWDVINSMKSEKTILISTHLLEEARNSSGRIIVMNHGQIKADGNLYEILKQAGSASLEAAFSKLTKA